MSTLEFQSPTLNQVLSDWMTISLESVPVNTQQVEYLVGYQSRGVATEYPFSLYWNPATLIADGDYEIWAIARDAFGEEIGRGVQYFTTNYRGNTCEITSPSIGTPYSGVVGIEFHLYDSLYWPIITEIYVDGIQVADYHTDMNHTQDIVGTYNLDTTLFRNGEHELYIHYHSHIIVGDLHPYYNSRGATIRKITIANSDTTVVGIRADMFWRELDTTGTATMQCYSQRADGSEVTTTGVSFSSDTPSVASVDSSSGVITAHAEGVAKITISKSGRTNTSIVSVRDNHNVSHFGGAGQMLTEFDDANSLFVVAPFELTPSTIMSNAGLDAETQITGINTLTTGMYVNVRNISASLVTWKASFDSEFAASWAPASEEGYHLYFTNDDMCRRPGDDGWYTLNWPSAPDAIDYMMTQTASLGTAIGVDVVDEVSLLWGGNPKPQFKVGGAGSFTSIVCSGTTCTVYWPNYSQYIYLPVGHNFALDGAESGHSALNTPGGSPFTVASATVDVSFTFTPSGTITGTFTSSTDPNLEYLYWSDATRNGSPCNPFIPNTAIQTLSDWMHAPTERIPISWPPLGVSDAQTHDNWMGLTAIANGISDYASHYWDSKQARHTYAFNRGIHEQVYYMTDEYIGMQNAVDRSRPQITLMSASGPEYIKQTDDPYEDFNPPVDDMGDPSMSSEGTMAQLINAAILGISGVRIYRFDSERSVRAGAGAGNYFQTGMYPSGLTKGHWRAVGYATKLLTTTLRPFVLGTVLSSPYIGTAASSGNSIHTAARTCAIGNMLMVLNITDGDYDVSVPFGSLATGNTITRYRLKVSSIAVDKLSATSGDDCMLSRGECLVYVFPFEETTIVAKDVAFVPA